MGYYIRVLATDASLIASQDLQACLPPNVELAIVAEDKGGWSQLALRHSDGQEIAIIERKPVVRGDVSSDEVAEFMDEVKNGKPDSARQWLEGYLTRVKAIYALQLLKGTDVHDGWTAVHALQTLIWNKGGGILQADGEGFSNEDGYHILWQFADNVAGPWKMALLDGDGGWNRFEMDLGNMEQRAAFLDGRIPDGVKLL